MQKVRLVILAAMVGCGSSNAGTSGGGANGAGTLDGPWDITANGHYGLAGAAQMTVSGSSVTGFIPSGFPPEGTTFYDDVCVATKSRTEFNFTVEGNALSGTYAQVLELTGSTCPSGFSKNETHTITGVRKREAPPSTTLLNGDWQVTGEGESWTGTVSDATVTATSTGAKRVPADTITVTYVDGLFTVSSSDPTIAFAARKR